jgi:hypothetical protein
MPVSDLSAAGAAEDFSERARAFARIHAGRPAQIFAANLSAKVETLQAGDTTMPVTISDGAPGDAWVCSPRATYADCAAEEAERYLPAWMARGSRGLSRGIGAWLSDAGIDRVAAVNNWLLSTNLYPPLRMVPLATLVDTARERWPDHAIWFRSLNTIDNADWIAALSASGFQPVVSRQVYLYQDLAALSARHANLKRDLQLLGRTGLRRVRNDGITRDDYARIARLYEMLYMEKYSRFNPHYNAAFMRSWHQAGLLEFHGFRDDSGVLQCVVGLFRQGAIVTSPIVGYDTSLPRQLGLYRLLTACAYEATMELGGRLNFSAGAAGFKRLRGGVPAIEYSAVYARHLPRKTRNAIGVLSLATRRVGAPLLSKYGL